jgi:RNA polymerase sigma-70 factor (ECF subfamily)
MLALQKQEEIIDRDHLLAWMRVTARLRAKNVLRAHRKERLPLSDELIEMLESRWRLHDPLPSSTILEALETCMLRLSEKVRKLLHDRYAEGIAMEEIARRLNRPVNSVYVSLSRGHQTLAECVFRRLADSRRGSI